MKRYRVLFFDFDSRPEYLKREILNEWDDKIKKQHRENKEKIEKRFIEQYGQNDSEVKIKNIKDLGNKPISILAFHNKFFNQIRSAFIMGAYYPALTAACALGERILNHLICTLREEFLSTPEYKKIYNKNSFDNWDLAIDTLKSWGVLLPEVAKIFRDLSELRHRSIHFNPDIDKNDRPLALQAINHLKDIIQKQFGAFGKQPWFIPGIKGASYIKKDAEKKPFIKHIYLPNCYLVGPKHTLEGELNILIVKDDHQYEDLEITDEQFRDLINRDNR